MAYTPPVGSAADLDLADAYSAPAGNAVVFNLGVDLQETLEVDVTGVVACEDGQTFGETQQITVVSVVDEEDAYEAGLVQITAVLDEEDSVCQEDRGLVVVSDVSGEDYFGWYEGPSLTIVGVVTEEDLYVLYEEKTVVIVGVVTCQEDVEERSLTIVGLVYRVEFLEIGEVDVRGRVYSEECMAYYSEAEVDILAVIKSGLIAAMAPVLKGRDPKPGETTVVLNKSVGFYLCAGEGAGGGGDPVDLSSVVVTINGAEYVDGDEWVHTYGESDQFHIEVDHPDFSYGQTVNVEIRASSLCGYAMTPVTYSFTTEWDSALTRALPGRIELYDPEDYRADVLTIEEDWVRQGVERYTAQLDLWYGRYQKLPFVENLQMMVTAGATVARGHEVLERGYFSVKVEEGSWEQVYPETVINLGPMFTHSKKKLYLKLLVPSGALTTKYFVLGFVFEPKMFFPFSRLRFGKGIFADSGNTIKMHPDTQIYRAYVLSDAMWHNYEELGFLTSPFWRGEDKQW